MFKKIIKNSLVLLLLCNSAVSFSQITEGDRYYKEENYTQAILQYEKALKNNSENISLLEKLAESYNHLYWEEKYEYMWAGDDSDEAKYNYNQALVYGKKALDLDQKNKKMLALLQIFITSIKMYPKPIIMPKNIRNIILRIMKIAHII